MLTGLNNRQLVEFLSKVRQSRPVQTSVQQDSELELDLLWHFQPVQQCDYKLLLLLMYFNDTNLYSTRSEYAKALTGTG